MNLIENANSRIGSGIYVFLLLILTAGAAAGSAYLARGWGEMGEGIRTYLESFFSSAQENVKNTFVVKTSLTSNLITLGIIFVMGFFRFGFLGTGAIIARRGFVTGFTSASFIKTYGAKGLIIMASTMPSALIYMCATIVFSAVSIAYSVKKDKFQKKNIFLYIFFAIFIVSIFCVASFSEGFITTTFMKWIYPKIT